MADPGEERLVAQVLAGNEAAFRTVFRQHSPVMYAVALRMLAGRVADAEDTVQEAWLRGVRGLATFRRESSLRTWLVGIVIRCALETCRRRPSAVEVDAEMLVTPPSTVGERIDLERAVAALADGYRHVVVLHDIHGYTHSEIAALLGIDEGTSKSQLSRARGVLRRALRFNPAAEEEVT
jgi:RNA polymerase sigma-70 factor (ECF subfamily)